MGFNATRRYRDKKTVDIALLVAAILIVHRPAGLGVRRRRH
jgi:hypothetical protein